MYIIKNLFYMYTFINYYIFTKIQKLDRMKRENFPKVFLYQDSRWRLKCSGRNRDRLNGLDLLENMFQPNEMVDKNKRRVSRDGYYIVNFNIPAI